MKYLMLLFALFVSSNLYSQDWLEKNYDVHITCDLKKAYVTRSDEYTYYNNAISISFHFSYDSDLYSYKKYRTCTSNVNVLNCYEKYSDMTNKDGIWICEGGGCNKGVITNEGPNTIYAIDSLGLFQSDTHWDFTHKTEYGKRPSGSIIEYVFDRTRGTLVESWIEGCYGDDSCEGTYLKSSGRNLPLHEKEVERFFTCQKIDKKF